MRMAAPDERLDAQIRTDQLLIMYKALPIALLASLINAAVLGWVQSPLISIEVIAAWLGAIALLSAWRFAGYFQYTRNPPRATAHARWTTRFFVEVLLSGALWGAAAFLLYPHDNPMHQMFLIFVLAGMGAGAVTTLSAMWSTALAYLIPALVPLIGKLVIEGTAISLPLSLMATLFLILISISALRARNNLLELLRARHAQAQAVTDLRLAATAFRSQEGILITDRRGQILRVNEAGSRISGYPEESLMGHPMRTLLPTDPASGKLYRRMVSALARNGFWSGECYLRTRSGQSLPVSATAAEVRDETGVASHFVGHFQDLSAYKYVQARLDFQTHHDALTGLPNRRLLSEQLDRDIARCRRSGERGAVIFIDLDHFKHANDALGHPVGDQLLETIAQRLSENIRGGDIAARFGGDEFVIVLTGLDSRLPQAAEQARKAAEKLREILAQPYRHNGTPLHLTASLGIALYPFDDEGADTVLTYADTALYRVKEHGRNGVAFYRPDMLNAVRTRLSTENALRKALEGDEFELAFQAQVDSRGPVVGVEALLRWQRPGHGPVRPGEFIPIAEDSGLILPIGDWVLRSACAALARWRSTSDEVHDLPLSVNVSPRQFFQSDFVERVHSCLEQYGLPGDSLELELTEGVLLDDITEARCKMHQLAEYGVRFALDDFGTGYSSLRYLQQLPISTLKIDQSFVSDLSAEGDHSAIVRTILSVAQHLGLKVVAEGVETPEQVRLLDELGCHVHQGYRYTKPVGETAFLAWFDTRSAGRTA